MPRTTHEATLSAIRAYKTDPQIGAATPRPEVGVEDPSGAVRLTRRLCKLTHAEIRGLTSQSHVAICSEVRLIQEGTRLIARRSIRIPYQPVYISKLVGIGSSLGVVVLRKEAPTLFSLGWSLPQGVPTLL